MVVQRPERSQKQTTMVVNVGKHNELLSLQFRMYAV